MRRQAIATAWAISLFACLATGPASRRRSGLGGRKPVPVLQADQVLRAARSGLHGGSRRSRDALPADIVWRTERRLNDPDCRDPSHPDKCAATAGKRYQQSRLGWAAQTVGETCYESNGRPRRYATACERKYSWGSAKEDYVLPDAHTVTIRLAPQHLDGLAGDCTWQWQPRKAGGKVESKKLACKNKLTIARVPYALDRAHSGVSVSVKLPDGRELVEPEVVVEDIFIVALGDSFASGESNPDRPVQFSASREMVYDPALVRQDVSRAPVTPPCLWPGGGRGPQQSQGAAAALHGGRSGRPFQHARFDANSQRPSRRHRRAGSAATATARNTAIRSAWRSSLRWRTAIAR